MEQQKTITQNVMPEVRLFDPLARLAKIGHFLFDQFRCEGLSDHNRGGGPALDAALYDQDQQRLW